MSDVATDVAAVIVDFHAGQALDDCVDSLHANGVTDIVVVENGDEGSTLPALSGQHVVLVVPKLNLGYGRGVNRGVAAAPARRYLLVSNPDVVVHEGAVAALVAFLDDHPNVAIVGPQIVRPDGSVYPSPARLPELLARRTARVARRHSGRAIRSPAATDRRARTARSTGSPAPSSWRGATVSKRSVDSTSATSCSPRTWRCAGRCALMATTWPPHPTRWSRTSKACRAPGPRARC